MARVLAESGTETSGNDDGNVDASDDHDPPCDAGGARPVRGR
jgi:hypothetical protein